LHVVFLLYSVMIARQGWIFSTPVAAGQETMDVTCPWRVLEVDVYGVHANTLLLLRGRPDDSARRSARRVLSLLLSLLLCVVEATLMPCATYGSPEVSRWVDDDGRGGREADYPHCTQHCNMYLYFCLPGHVRLPAPVKPSTVL
jgi:hypothetical protein